MARSRLTTAGILLFFGALLVGIAPTVIGMIDAFSSLQTVGSNSESIAVGVGNGLSLTIAAIPVAGLGLALVLVGYLKAKLPSSQKAQ
jgi:biopolymer transport protein ExbB/TolQ